LLLQCSGDPDAKSVYSKIRRALVLFITCRLGINNAGISDNHLIDALKKETQDSSLIQRVEKVLKKCATIRYSPDPPVKNVAMDLTEAHNMLTQLKARL
ncbi:hypothetical protein QLX67_12180, partial [Balneolaceae bacterium ANBcel3]|nr:hypothetical protein [Balneolaceae bacterium ANBcel3]